MCKNNVCILLHVNGEGGQSEKSMSVVFVSFFPVSLSRGLLYVNSCETVQTQPAVLGARSFN